MSDLETLVAEEESITAASAPQFVLSGGEVNDVSDDDEDEDDIAKDIREGLSRYKRGHDKAALFALADAVNAIAARKSIQGGAWY